MLAGSVSLHAQGPRVTLDMQNVTVLEVLESIEQTSDYAFFYNNADFDTGKKVSVKVDGQPVEAVIEQILPGFACWIDNKKIILLKPGEKLSDLDLPEDSGEYEITGVIRDSGGDPLVGASALIRYKGKLYGGTADLDGKFTVLLPGRPEASSNIVFSFMGFADMPDQDLSRYGLIGSPTAVERMFAPPEVEKKVYLTGDPKEKTEKLFLALSGKKLI